MNTKKLQTISFRFEKLLGSNEKSPSVFYPQFGTNMGHSEWFWVVLSEFGRA